MRYYITINPGDRFGRWTALYRMPHRSHHQWWCRCDCGEEGTVRAHRLKNGKAPSCGCLRWVPETGEPPIDGEVWRPIPGIAYEVSDIGRVRSAKTKRVARLQKNVARGRYFQVRLAGRNYKVHRLVCLAFHGNPPDGRTHIRHLNGDPADNRPENLRWGNAAENTADKFRHGRVARGERAGGAKLSDAQAAEIFVRYWRLRGSRGRLGAGELEALAAEYSASRQTVMAIAAGRRRLVGLAADFPGFDLAQIRAGLTVPATSEAA